MKAWKFLMTAPMLLLALGSAEAKTRVLIVTGIHPYDTLAFDAMWNSFTDMEVTVKPQAYGQEVFEDVSNWNYDVLVFYNHQDPGDRLTERHKKNFQTLVDKGVGMFVLHHGVAAYPFWPEYEAMAGVRYRSAAYFKDTLSTAIIGVVIPCSLSEATHPMAGSMPAAFKVTDEVYFKMKYATDNRNLITTTYPESQGPLAWTRKYGNSRVFTTVLGHGSTIFADVNFRKMVSQAVAWIKPCTVGDGRSVCVAAPVAPKRILIFHKQNGFIHVDTDSCVKVLIKYLAAHGLPAESTKDSLDFNPTNLARFGALVFYNTNYRNGALLTRPQEMAVEGFIHNGGGFVGIHSAIPLNGAWEETVWPWYARLFGARFQVHPPFDLATMVIEKTGHSSTAGLPDRISLKDEWYQTQANPRDQVGRQVLASLDAASYPAGKVTGDHPVSWQGSFEGGRSWVTLVGHDLSAFSNPDYLAHVKGGILWAGKWDGSLDPGTSNIVPGRARVNNGARSNQRPATNWIYRSTKGGRLEIRNVSGRFIDVVRTR